MHKSTHRVFIIDDDEDYQQTLSLALRGLDVQVVSFFTAETAIARLKGDPGSVDLIFTDIQLPGQSGFEFLRAVQQIGCTAPVLVLTAQGSIQGAVEALRLGARNYLTKPLSLEQVRRTVRELLRDPPTGAAQGFEGMLGTSPRMLEVFDRVRRVANSLSTVLITGESGTGKELVARAIHKLSRRAEAPFVSVHTGTIPRELVASELFGYQRGAFSSAIENTDGKFAAASRGTLFLDEIGTMDSPVQMGLLRVLGEGRYTRLGDNREREADVRVVSATHEDLATMVANGSFRQDLYYRIHEVSVTLPPLRARGDDVVILAQHFLSEYARKNRTTPKTLSASAIDRIRNHAWPGNVRELRNVMAQITHFHRDDLVHADHLPIERAHSHRVEASAPAAASAPEKPTASQSTPHDPAPGAPVPRKVQDDMSEQLIKARTRIGPNATNLPDDALLVQVTVGTTIDAMERELILRTLNALNHNKMQAARMLGISRRCLYNKLAAYGLPTTPNPEPGSDSTRH